MRSRATASSSRPRAPTSRARRTRSSSACSGALFDAPLVVAQTTTLAHLAALPILVGKDDAVVCDQMVHNSVQAVLPTLAAAGTTCRFVRHNRMDRLDQLVGVLAAEHRRVWYLADGVYSMHGDVAPLDQLRELASRHDRLWLYIDDAHGVSWSGRHGRGTVLGNGGAPPRTVMVASLAKAFSAGGAVIVTPDAETARFIRTCGSTLIFSGPAAAGAAGRRDRVGAGPPVARDPRTPAPAHGPDPAVQRPGGRARPAARITGRDADPLRRARATATPPSGWPPI